MAVVLFFCFGVFLEIGVSAYELILNNSGPAVRGNNVTFTATVTDYYDDTFLYEFWDDTKNRNSGQVIVTAGVANWTQEYPKSMYAAGEYTATVQIKKKYFEMWYPVQTTTCKFSLTDTLNGQLILNQDNEDRPNNFVKVNRTVTHTIKLLDSDMDFLTNNASTVATYWFIDCSYVMMTSDLSFQYTYSDVMGDHNIEAIVAANNKPLPPITTTTTTTTTTSTTTTTTTTSTTTTTPKPATLAVLNITKDTSNNATSVHSLVKRELPKPKNRTTFKESICNNSLSYLPTSDDYTIGHYRKTISVREPITTINISGLNWLQHGELMNLQVKYAGTPPFNYCVQYKLGEYNVTGNETCSSQLNTDSNGFSLIHYFPEGDQHTVVVVIENVVGRSVSRATINVYKAVVQAQLSVIVVPVAFCLLAVILVVFGVAYYQHRSRYTVEVADFDFGQANLDYKTFTERLRDSFRGALSFRQHDDLDALVANTRYDSM